MSAPIVLVTMPWGSIQFPSIQLGTLKSVLRRGGHEAQVLYLNLKFAEFVIDETAKAAQTSGEEPISIQDLLKLGDNPRLGDWVFAVPPFRAPDDVADRDFLAPGAGDEPAGERTVARLRRLRALAPAFLEACLDDIVSLDPGIVGFTSSFGQNVASLALAQRIKARIPATKIVFGGANCDGPMGAALHRLFPWVDVVVRGEAERVVTPVFEDLLAGRAVRDLPGVCRRDAGGDIVTEQSGDLVSMDEVPAPDYDEYFDALAVSPLQHDLLRDVRILYESARGCWWGEKNHCTFCGLNGSSMKFRSKGAEQTYREMVELGRRHANLQFQVVDNIIEMRYLDELLPRLRDTGWDWNVFYETKANLKRDQLRLFREAGVREIQPGIESLSTPTLKLMKKGVTALQNIRLLKWCAELGIHCEWNLIFGFPGEDPAEYQAMAALIPSLVHFVAPGATPLNIERFSPYHEHPERYGIEIVGAARHYAVSYALPAADLAELAYAFQFRYVDGRDPRDYAGPLVAQIAVWRDAEASGTLSYELGPGFVVIDDHRPTVESARYTFHEREALIYLACDAGATAAQVHDFLSTRGEHELTPEDIAEFLDNLVELRLVYRERGKYLSLATARDQHRALSRLGITELDDEHDRDEAAAAAGLIQLKRAASHSA